jgi:predicted dienelactone hydrolase
LTPLVALLLLGCAAILLLPTALPAFAQMPSAGFERVDIPRRNGQRLQGAFWYPSTSQASPMRVGLTEQVVAERGVIAGHNLPLVVISHGALGSWSGHADTAVALARAGFVAAAVTHDEFTPGGVLELGGRAGQLSALIDFALHDWRGRAELNPAKIGAFGFSGGRVYRSRRGRRQTRCQPDRTPLQICSPRVVLPARRAASS